MDSGIPQQRALIIEIRLGGRLFCGYVGSCQNHGPFLGTLNIRCRIIIGTRKRDHKWVRLEPALDLQALDPPNLTPKP